MKNNTSCHIIELDRSFPNTDETIYAILAPITVGAHFKGIIYPALEIYINAYIIPSYESTPDGLCLTYTVSKHQDFGSQFSYTLSNFKFKDQEYLALQLTSKGYASCGCKIYCMEASHPEVVQWAYTDVSAGSVKFNEIMYMKF